MGNWFKSITDSLNPVKAFTSTVGSVVGLYDSVAGLFGQSSADKAAKKQRQWQSDENAKQRDWQTEEAEKDRQWQADEWTRQFDAQSEEWYRQLAAQSDSQWQTYQRQQDYERAYNDPSAVVARYQSAGINAGAMMGQGGGGLQSAPPASPMSSAAPSPPSGGSVSGAMPSGGQGGSGAVSDSANNISRLGQFLNEMSEAGARDAKLRPEIDLLKQETLNKIADTHQKEVMTDIFSLQFEVEEITKDAKISRLMGEAVGAWVDVYLKHSMGEMYDSQTVLNKSYEAVARAEEKLKGEQLNLFKLYVATFNQKFEQEMKYMKALTRQSDANAAQSYSMVPLNKAMAENWRLRNAVDEVKVRMQTDPRWFDGQWKLFTTSVKQSDVYLRMTDAQRREFDAAAEIAEYRASKKEIDYAIEKVDQCIGIVGTAAGAAGSVMTGIGSLKSAGAFGKMADARLSVITPTPPMLAPPASGGVTQSGVPSYAPW